MATRTRSLSPPPASLNRSPFSLTKHAENTDEIDPNEELTTSGRTYQELVEQFGTQSDNMTEESEGEEYDHRKSLLFLSGRNSISNWTTFNNTEEDTLNDVPVSEIRGGETRVSSLETPLIAKLDSSCVNLSQRNARVNSRQRCSQRSSSYAKVGSERRPNANNLSHISSSSSSIGEDLLGESWSPIRSSLENSLKEKSPTRGLSRSPFRLLGRSMSPLKSNGKAGELSKSPPKSARKSRSKSPLKSPVRSPTRSPLADIISPNRSRGQSPKKSPQKSSLKEALSPNGTYSLREAEEVTAQEQTKAKSSAKTKIALPSLGRKPEITQLFSPEKLTTGVHTRSPAPTPNSQRRVIKRLRASLPTANYMDKDEVMEEDEEDALSKLNTEVIERLAVTNETAEVPVALPPMTYENEFEFPDISGPCNATLALFHKDAIAQGSSSHQYQLSVAGTDLISMQEVILPSVAYETNGVLKKFQAKAQRNVLNGLPDSQGKDVVDVIETCRKVVSKCTTHAIQVAGKSWRDRQETRQQAHLEQYAQDLEKQQQLRVQAKLQRQEDRALANQQHYERQKYEKQKSHPRNKEMWQEVAKLMIEIQKLEKEERLWKDALAEVDLMEKNFQPPEKMDLASLEGAKSPRVEEQEQLCNAVEVADLKTKSTTLVQDITMATERISWMLQSVSIAMEESDRLRQEAYRKYQYEGHKLYGYQMGDSKGLFVALSMDDSFAG